MFLTLLNIYKRYTVLGELLFNHLASEPCGEAVNGDEVNVAHLLYVINISILK